MLLHLDLALRREPRADERRPDPLTEPGLGEEQEVLDPTAQNDERRDHPRLRGEEERLAGLADPERLDVVRDHRLQVALRAGPAHADELAWATGDACRGNGHRD